MRKSCLRNLEYILPVSGKEFSVLMPTMYEELYIARKVHANPKMGQLEGITHLLSTLVNKIGDKEFTLDSEGRISSSDYKKVISELLVLPASDVLTLYLIVQMEIDCEYTFEFECPECEGKNKATYDIGDLAVEIIENDEEPYKAVTLKHGITQVDTILKDVIVTHVLWKYIYKVKNLADNKIAMLKHGILTLDKLPITLSTNMLYNIKTPDKRLIYKCSDEVPGGTKVAFDVTCPTCEKEGVWDYDIPASFDFFL